MKKHELQTLGGPFVVDIDQTWTGKGHNCRPEQDSHERIFKPADNSVLGKQEGCMNKVRVERALKLQQEETKGRRYNILNGVQDVSPKRWLGAFGSQLQKVDARELEGVQQRELNKTVAN